MSINKPKEPNMIIMPAVKYIIKKLLLPFEVPEDDRPILEAWAGEYKGRVRVF